MIFSSNTNYNRFDKFDQYNVLSLLLGWSSSIPNYNPRDIVENLKLIMDGKEPVHMHPWYRGFQGEIEDIGKDKYKVRGIIKPINNKSEVRITELPIRIWTQNY